MKPSISSSWPALSFYIKCVKACYQEMNSHELISYRQIDEQTDGLRDRQTNTNYQSTSKTKSNGI